MCGQRISGTAEISLIIISDKVYFVKLFFHIFSAIISPVFY